MTGEGGIQPPNSSLQWLRFPPPARLDPGYKINIQKAYRGPSPVPTSAWHGQGQICEQFKAFHCSQGAHEARGGDRQKIESITVESEVRRREGE